MPGHSFHHFGHRHPLQSSSLRRLTGVKRSAFGRLSGRQRPYADTLFVDVKRLRPGDRGSGSSQSHDKPLRGLPAAVRSPFPAPPPLRERGRGLPTRHSLRERRLPLDVSRHCVSWPEILAADRPFADRQKAGPSHTMSGNGRSIALGQNLSTQCSSSQHYQWSLPTLDTES